MPESELAQDLTRAIKRLDKLVRDLKKDTSDLLESVRKLKKEGMSEEDEEDRQAGK